MSAFAWIVSTLLAALVLWTLVKTVVHRFLTVDESLLSTLKLMLRHRGLDPEEISDAALVDIIVAKIEAAKQKAAACRENNHPPEDWHRYLIGLLDTEADMIESIMRNGCEEYSRFETTRILLKYGSVEPRYPQALSAEQFIEAAKRGTLYAELDERISKREFT